MTSKLVVNTIESDTGISSVSFASSISMSSTSKFFFSAAGIDIGADTNINRPASGVLGFNINSSEKVRIDSSGQLGIGTNSPKLLLHLHQENSNATFAHFTNTTTGINANQGVSFGLDSNEDATIYHYGSKAIRFATGGTEKVRIDSSGRVLLGHNASVPTGGSATAHLKLQVLGTGFDSSGIFQQRYQDASAGASLYLGHSRGGIGVHTALQQDDEVGKIGFVASDGTDFAGQAGRIQCKMAANASSDDTPGYITFNTTPSGTNFPVERVRINQHGGLRVFAAASDPTGIQAGEIYYNTTTNRLRVYNGSRWLNPDENKDPYASSVVCLFNGDSYTDLTGRHTLTQVGAGGLSNNYMSPVGSTSTYRMAHSNSTGNYMNITGNLGDFRLDDGNWTMEFWVRTTGTNGYQHYFIADGQNTKGTFKGYTNNSSVTEMAYFYSSNGTGVMYNPGGSPFAYNDWQHYAWDRTGSTTRFYLDGVVRASSTAAYPGGNPTLCHIGKWNNEAREFYIDNFRFTRGVARYGGNGFEVPRTKYSSG